MNSSLRKSPLKNLKNNKAKLIKRISREISSSYLQLVLKLGVLEILKA